MSTIAAIATARGEGGIAIVRVSGDKAERILRSAFRPAGRRKETALESHRLYFGRLMDGEGGVIDEVLMRICDALTAFPSVLLALIVLAVLGPGRLNVIGVLALVFIPSFARIVRAEFSRIKKLNYVSLAKLQGVGNFRIMLKHILPNTLPVLLPAISIGFNNAVLAEASMSFLGVGVSASEVSLGRMLSESQNYILRGMPWYAIFVGLTIALLILGFSLLGEGLQQEE